MELAGLDEIRQELIESDDLGAVMDRFFQLVEKEPDLLDAGRPVRDGLLEQILAAAAKGTFGRHARVEQMCLYRIDAARLVHGALTFAGRPATLLWFEGVQVGLVSALDLREGGHVHHIRMSGFVLPR